MKRTGRKEQTRGIANPNTAIIYCRVSTQKQASKGISLDMQLARCTEYAANHGLNVLDIIIDAGISAKDVEHRPGMRRIIDMAKNRTVAHILSFKLDRLFRNTQDTLNAMEMFTRYGVKVHLVSECRIVQTESADDEFMLGIHAATSTLERKRIGERTRAALARKRELGEFTGGRAPYGYRYANGGFVVDATEQDIIRKMRTFRNHGYSLRKVAVCLKQDGITNRSGGMFHPNQIQKLLG
jgi:DNA invertase Pin-like site-specific DNA recombinase